jgi:predicted Zn-dependent protease
MSFLAFQRKFETEADALAIRSMSAAGFDPEALARYFGRTQPKETGVSKVFSGLPPLKARLVDIKKTIQGLGPRTYAPANELSAIQAEVRRVPPSEKAPPAPSLKRPNEAPRGR